MRRGLAVLLLSAAASRAGPWSWSNNLGGALKSAAREGRPVLVEFTDGKHEKRLEEQLYSTDEFRELVREHRPVLVRVDFSARVFESRALEYKEAKGRFGVGALPTLVVLDERGRLHARLPVTSEAEVEACRKVLDAHVAGAASSGPWLWDWEAAKAEAKRLKRPMLVNFTGSDW